MTRKYLTTGRIKIDLDSVFYIEHSTIKVYIILKGGATREIHEQDLKPLNVIDKQEFEDIKEFFIFFSKSLDERELYLESQSSNNKILVQ